MFSNIHSSYKKFFGFVSFIGLTFFIIQYRITMTRKEALDRFSTLEDGKNFQVQSVSFAPKVQYPDSGMMTSNAINLLNNYIKTDRIRYLRSKTKKE